MRRYLAAYYLALAIIGLAIIVAKAYPSECYASGATHSYCVD